MLSELDLSQQATVHRRRRYIVLGLGILILAVLIYFGPAFRKHEPNYYDPARVALVNAKLQFEESLGHERELIEQLQMAHDELDSAITHLAQAADLDPADRSRIETLRASLRSIEGPDRLGKINLEELHRIYRDMLAQMETLITDLDKRTR